MTQLGIIGSGAIGAALARLAVNAHIEVTIANSRGPETLAELIDELGHLAHAGTVEDAARYGDLTLLAVPLISYPDLPIEALSGRTIVSTGNYYPYRDGRITALDNVELTTAQYEQKLLPESVVTKAFNNIVAHHIPLWAHSQPPTALPVACDDARAKGAVHGLVEALGFEAVDAGSLADSWRFEPESGAYTPIYAASAEGMAQDYLADRGAPLPAARLRELLAASHRPDVAARQF